MHDVHAPKSKENTSLSNQLFMTKKILKTKVYVSERTSKIYHYVVVTLKNPPNWKVSFTGQCEQHTDAVITKCTSYQQT